MPRPIRYPDTPQQNAARVLLGGPNPGIPGHVSEQLARVNALYGSRDINAVASNAGAAGVVPWPQAAKSKKAPLYDKTAVQSALTSPRAPQATDPRQLHATQSGITRDGIQYYSGDEYNQTGRTYADNDNAGNRTPVVYQHPDGRNLLLSGHHRATAALLRGEQFDAIHVKPSE